MITRVETTKEARATNPLPMQDVLDAIERVIKEGKEVAADLADSQAAGLAPGRILRQRRKSRDLEAQCMQLMGDSLERAFKTFDADGNGTLDAAELKEAYKLAGRAVTDDQIKDAIIALDTNNDGLISLDEFKAIAWRIGTSH